MNRYLDYFYKKIVDKELSKIDKYGHTDFVSSLYLSFASWSSLNGQKIKSTSLIILEVFKTGLSCDPFLLHDYDNCFLWANPASFCLFSSFSQTISIIQIIEICINGVLGIQTRGCRMVGAGKTTEFVCHHTTITLIKS